MMISSPSIIEKRFSAFYMERWGKELVPASKGIQVVGLAPADLRSAEITAKWEKRLGDIAQGREREQNFVGEMRAYASGLASQVKASGVKCWSARTGSAATAAASPRLPTPAVPQASGELI